MIQTELQIIPISSVILFQIKWARAFILAPEIMQIDRKPSHYNAITLHIIKL